MGEMDCSGDIDFGNYFSLYMCFNGGRDNSHIFCFYIIFYVNFGQLLNQNNDIVTFPQMIS